MHLDILVVRFRQKIHLKRDQRRSFESGSVPISNLCASVTCNRAQSQNSLCIRVPGTHRMQPGAPCTYYGPLPKGIAWRDNSAPFAIYSVAIKTKNLDIHVCVCVCVTLGTS
jgi:hypothetical protein